MRQSKIYLPEDKNPAIQMSLFGALGHEKLGDLNPFPELLQNDAGYERVLDRAKDCIGMDFEFKKYNKASLIGIANRDLAACVKCEDRRLKRTVDWCIKNNIRIVGHSAIGAEKRVIEETLGIKFPLELLDDSMVSHYICHHDFTKNSGKDDDEGSLGLMNLYTCMSMTTDTYQYKICRGRACEGPCPSHEVKDYCSVDAWGSIESHYVHMEEMRQMGVPHQFYRELIELSEICNDMEVQGIRINIPYVEQLDIEMEAAKDEIFKYEIVGKNRHYFDFNPKSPDQIIEWFKARGQNYKTTDIKYIQKVLEKQGALEEHGELDTYLQFLEENIEAQNEVTKNLYKLYKFKKSGKGSSAWFDEKYRDGDLVHPRFISTGTSSGRLASSRPNWTNIPVRGWAVSTNNEGEEFHRIKAGILPRSDDLDYLESDSSQLELRTVLYLAGVDPSVAGSDAYSWLVKQAYESFKQATAIWPGLDPESFQDVRQVGKSMAIAANYLEGIKVFYAEDLDSLHVKRQVSNGSLRLYRNWSYMGGVVGFTGANLAMRFFGSRSDENRKRALDIQEDAYFANFPVIRKWQQSVLAQIEARGYVQSPTGRFLRLYGSPEENAKIGVAFLGQGVGADYVEGVMLNYKRHENIIPDLMVHDSLLFGIPKSWSDKKCVDFLQPMYSELGFRLPGFKSPGSAKRGNTYGTLKKIKLDA